MYVCNMYVCMYVCMYVGIKCNIKLHDMEMSKLQRDICLLVDIIELDKRLSNELSEIPS